MTDLFQAQAQIKKVETLSDRTLKLTVYTQEVSPEENALLFKLHGQLGWFVFKETEVKREDIPTEEVTLEGKYKTPSQELRAAMFVYWRDKTDQLEDFDTQYYPRQMRRLKERILEGLD